MTQLQAGFYYFATVFGRNYQYVIVFTQKSTLPLFLWSLSNVTIFTQISTLPLFLCSLSNHFTHKEWQIQIQWQSDNFGQIQWHTGKSSYKYKIQNVHNKQDKRV
jgi:hypothetical protein